MSMMRSNLLSETSEFRLLQLRSISPGGLFSHKSRSIAFGNPAGGRLPGQSVKLQLSLVPLPLAITNVRHVRAKCCSDFNTHTWYDMDRPWNCGIVGVPEKRVYVIERSGKYFKTLTTPGYHFLNPFVDKVAYVHSCGSGLISIPELSVTTKDGYTIYGLDGSLFLKIVDPILASYGVGDPIDYMIQLAHATIRSELGKMTCHMIIEEDDTFGKKIVMSMNEDEGVKGRGFHCHTFVNSCLVRLEMYYRTGIRKRPKGDAETIIEGARSIAEDMTTTLSKNLKAVVEDITMVSKNLKAEGGVEVSSLRIAEDEAFDKIAERVAAKVFAMIENLGLLKDAANPSAMKGETDQASLPQIKHDVANPYAMKGQPKQASLPQSKHDVANPGSAEPSFFTKKQT